MELKDFVVTPLVLFALYYLALKIRSKVCTVHTVKYFLPALTLKFIGALALGLIYQYYYGGGDTFGYTTHGSHFIWEAFKDNPVYAIQLIFFDNDFKSELFEYSRPMWYYDDSPAYFVVRVAGIFSLITIDTYSSIALLFAAVGFTGLWALYSSLVKMYPSLSFQLALAFFAIPSVVFWGSGVMKDTLTLSAVSWTIHAVLELLIFKKRSIKYYLIIVFSIWTIYIIKIYILICLVPAILIWLFLSYLKRVKSLMLRYLLIPIIFLLPLLISIYSLTILTQGNDRYSFDNLLSTAEITALDNSLGTVRAEGSGYNLGDYDFSPAGLARKFVPAVWLTLFRPYIWEANSIVMILSSLESFGLLFFTLFLIANAGLIKIIRQLFKHPIVIMCFIFTISFAFAVGISSGNFGSLVRYKIPIMPFFLTGLLVLKFYSQKHRITIQTSLKNLID